MMKPPSDQRHLVSICTDDADHANLEGLPVVLAVGAFMLVVWVLLAFAGAVVMLLTLL